MSYPTGRRFSCQAKYYIIYIKKKIIQLVNIRFPPFRERSNAVCVELASVHFFIQHRIGFRLVSLLSGVEIMIWWAKAKKGRQNNKLFQLRQLRVTLTRNTSIDVGKTVSFPSVSETNHLNTLGNRGVPVRIFPRRQRTVLVSPIAVTLSKEDSPIVWCHRGCTDVYSREVRARARVVR